MWYAEHDIDLRLGATVAAVDPIAHEVTFAGGSRLDYAKLLLTTGRVLAGMNVNVLADLLGHPGRAC
ncbi:hypothetical protein M271_01125 [Streptomyces rapamycinicus NRRL 5491]|uniref:Uncharacterized protein n=2 Tax=Streptomyces rapamycinicus TaxID=1226757 RepID=A0A0A0N3A3_STRRN|nr:hypothetical protein M271_01125 [Streptomyces rapamycinicus NRRL 5491]RLV76058.1 hypothetical protein D3C57_142570 [Streptomyces rapamycinicus NRRL 5491]